MTQQKTQFTTQYNCMSDGNKSLNGVLPERLVAVMFAEYRPSVLVASLYLGEGLHREIEALGGTYLDDITPEEFIELLNQTSARLARAEDEDLIIKGMVNVWKEKHDAKN